MGPVPSCKFHVCSCMTLPLSFTPLLVTLASPTEKLLIDPGVGKPDGVNELDRMVCVSGMSRGAGLLPLPKRGEDDGEADAGEADADGL